MIIACPKIRSGGVTFNRMYQPMRALVQKHKDVKVIFFDMNAIAEGTYGADIYFAPSATGKEHLEVIKFLKKYNKIEVKNNLPKLNIVLDYDDAPEEYIRPSNPYYAAIGTKEKTLTLRDGTLITWKNRKSHVEMEGMDILFDINRNIETIKINKEIKENADYITTTTEYLADKLKPYNDNITVLPNSIDKNIYTATNNITNEIRIGWMIGGSHIEDYANLKSHLKNVLNRYSNVKLILMANGTIDYSGFPENKIEVLNGVRIVEGYHEMFNMLNIDIGIAHLENNMFNLCKSPLKILEYGASKISVIASNTMYDNFLEHKKTGIIYNTKYEFESGIDLLINNKALRKEIGQNLYNYVIRNYTTDIIADQYYDFFSSIITKYK